MMEQAQLTPEQQSVVQAILDPVLFAKTFLQTECWEVQAQILYELAKDHSRVAVKACHSSSKTFTAGIAALWFLARYIESIVVTTAPTWNQVEKLLWGEIHSALARSKYDYPKANQTELNFLSKGYPKRYAQGLATAVTKQDEGVKFQGYHAENLLFILDEAPGVDPKLWEAIEGAAAGGNVRILAIGNPTISGGPFHDCFTKSRSGWKPITISAFDTPNLKGLTLEQLIDPQFPDEELDKNVLPYLTTRRWVRNQYFKWGKDHPFFQARVLGNFPLQAEDALLSLTWLEQASTDYRVQKLRPQCKGKLRAGLDVAGPGEDESSLTIVDGPEIILHKQFTNPDPRGEVVFELNKIRSRLEQVNVDCIGIGWGMYNHLKDLKFPVQPINICETSSDPELYADCKAEYYWGLRTRFEQGDVSGLADQDTIGQLASIKWKVNSRGQIDIESKEDARKRGVPSPDRAESIMLAFAGRNPATFGVLEYLKQLKRQQENKTAPLTIVEALPPCPTCSSPSTKTQNHFRCQQCGLEFGQEPKKQEPPKADLTNRKAYIDRLERAKRFRMR